MGLPENLRALRGAMFGCLFAAGCSAGLSQAGAQTGAKLPSTPPAPEAVQMAEPASLAEPASAAEEPPAPARQLAFADEFEGPAGSPPDASKWTHDRGGSGWGNDELQYYTDSTRNAALDGSGALVITARAERRHGRNYTSARLKTLGRFAQAYGRFEARIRIPQGQGIWPAFWLLGSDMDAVGWPQCGEIDVMENIGREPTLVYGTVHGPGYSDEGGIGAAYGLPGGARFADDYHVYAVEWEPEAVRWYVDGALRQTLTPGALPRGARWVLDHPFFILLNVAVGGRWPGPPDKTTQLPQQMLVDYVRVYTQPP